MSTARNLTRGLWCKFVLLSVTFPLLSGSAFAQIPAPDSSSSANPFSPKMSLGEKEKRQLTPEEQERQRQLDAAYKAATKKIPDQKTADPWGGVRPTPTVKGQSKNESLTPYHRDSFNEQTKQWADTDDSPLHAALVDSTAKMLTKDEARRIAANAAHCDKEAEVLWSKWRLPTSVASASIVKNFAQSVALVGAFAVATGTMALAQQPAAPAAPAPAKTPPQQQQQPQLIFSPWTKLCRKQNDSPYAKQVCFTRKEARNESGLLVVAAVLIEPEGDTNKIILRVTLPLGLQLTSGTRVIVDSNRPMTAPFGICFPDGCLVDYDASGGDLIANMKKGHGLTIQAINSTGQPISLTLPLSDFAKAYDGPPTDPKVIDEHQKLQEELQQRADGARKKLEPQQGQPQSSNAPSPDVPQAAGKP